jgi:DNA end-binding protein Ku
MSEDWKPEQYHDTYREDVMALVEKKVKAKQTKTITMPGKEKAAATSGNVIDLVALLQQSIGKKPGKAAAANDEDDEEEEDEAPAPKTRKAPAKTAAKTAAKAAAKPKAKAAPAAKAASPARRKSA